MKRITLFTLISISTLVFYACCTLDGEKNISGPDDAKTTMKGSRNIDNVLTPETIGLAHYESIAAADSYLRGQYNADTTFFWTNLDSFISVSHVIAGNTFLGIIDCMDINEFLKLFNRTNDGRDVRSGIFNDYHTMYLDNQISKDNYYNITKFLNDVFDSIDNDGFNATATFLSTTYTPIKDVNVLGNNDGDYYALVGFTYYSFMGTGTYLNPLGEGQGDFGEVPTDVDWGDITAEDIRGFTEAIMEERTPGEWPSREDGEWGYAVGRGAAESIKEYHRQINNPE